MLLRASREAHDRNILRRGEHQRRARRYLPDLEAPCRDHSDAVDVWAAGLEAHLDAFLVVIAELLGADLADLVAREEPAKLHIDDGLGLAVRVHANQSRGCCSRAGSRYEVASSDVGHRGPPIYGSSVITEAV